MSFAGALAALIALAGCSAGSAATRTSSADALAQLDDWIQWLTGRYRLDYRTVPHCWAAHGELIEERCSPRAWG